MCEEIVNLGNFWRADALRSSREEIIALNRGKTRLWRQAYRWLAGCLDMCDIIRDIGALCADAGEIGGAAQEILSGVPAGKEGRVRTAIIGSVGMAGAVRSGEYIRRAAKLWMVRDRLMSAHLLIRALMSEAARRELSVSVSYDPVDASRPDAIFIEEENIAVVVGEETPERDFAELFMEELINPPSGRDTALAAHAESCREAMLAGALDALREIKELHFRLEEIYTSAMDFSALNEYTALFCAKYFA